MSAQTLLRAFLVAVVTSCFSAASFVTCAAENVAEQDEKLPIRRVVLYNSGVGFFERKGTIRDNATIDLRFGSRDINDLLKSLVLEDLNGGTVDTVSYSARNPVSQTLKTFAIDLTGEPSLADLLRQVRGEAIRINVSEPIEGRILGVEQRKQMGERGTVVTWDIVNLMTSEGLRSISLDSAVEIRLLDEKLNAELTEALGLLSKARSTDKKTVTLRCTGKGERTLRVGYIQETPVWKTSYRLLLRDDAKPFLQGWAIVENTSDHDWNDVRLSLVSGRPISFIMDLYQPLYAARPSVQPELFAGLKPQRHGQDLQPRTDKVAAGGRFGAGMGGIGGGGGYFGGGFGGGGLAGAPLPPAAPPAPAAAEEPEDEGFDEIQATAPTAAEADTVGELFRYAISAPVTLARQQSAMLPIVNESIEGEKVGIFNPATDARHPLNAFQLKNSTSLHLMQGPISVLDAGEYAGDAQIADVAPNAERLISFSLDLDTEVVMTTPPEESKLVALKVVEGLLTATDRAVRSRTYRLKNSSNKDKKILVEQPLSKSWTLESPKPPREITRNLYRFAVEVPAQKSVELQVVESREIANTIAMGDLAEEHLLIYRSGTVASDELKSALGKLQQLRVAVQQAEAQSGALHRRIEEISAEQTRIRANMQALEKTSDLYKRYVKKFSTQEDTIESLREKQPAARDAEIQARKALNDFMAQLTVQ